MRMKPGHLPVVLAAAAALAAMPVMEGTAPFAGVAQAQGVGGAGPGDPGGRGGPDSAGGLGGAGGVAGVASARGMGVASAAVDPDTTGLDKAESVLYRTPADQEALDAVAAAREEQQTAGIADNDDDMSFGEAMGNMAEDARAALSAIFGGASR